MDKPAVTKQNIIIVLLFSIFILIISFVTNLLDPRTKVVFCNVGQGDAAYIRVKNKIDILIDAGPDRSVLNCLGKYMPFYDKKIEIVFLSHPQKDHYGGLLYILDHYSIGSFFMPKVDNKNTSFVNIKNKLQSKRVPIYFPLAKMTYHILSDGIEFLSPDSLNLINNNDASLVFQFIEGSYKILFTGDIDSRGLNKLMNGLSDRSLIRTTILKVPHHGSKTGLNRKFLQLADPTLSVISVGKKNAYGHPSKEVTDLFNALNRKYIRTDEKGDIVIRL